MNLEKLTRATLLLSAPFNLVAACGLLFPASSLGQLIGLPSPVPVVYSAILAYMVLIFGGVYAWLALQDSINRPLLAVGVIGKLGVFAICLGLWLMSQADVATVLVSSVDLALGLLWLSYLLETPPSAAQG